MKKEIIGANGNGTYTRIDVNDDELISRDIMPGKMVQNILDANAAHRSLGRNPNKHARGRLAASIPITLYTEWKKDWRNNHSDKWSWETFLTVKLNNRDYSHLKTTEMHL